MFELRYVFQLVAIAGVPIEGDGRLERLVMVVME
jgi:hypothetical protein